MKYKRIILIVLDSVGIGAMPDAAEFGADDVGTDTLGNIARAMGGLSLPNLGTLGIGNIAPIQGVSPAESPAALFGKAALAAPNKDTTSGHWEMMTCVLTIKLRTFLLGFPEEIIREFSRRAGVRQVLGNLAISGTEVINRFGDEHVRTGYPIVYTSADSVFQIACHEESFGLSRLYEICEAAREILRGDWEVGRVIARPFIGSSGSYKRTTNRRDYSLEPPSETVLDLLSKAGIPVYGIGKIKDIFAGRGISECAKTCGNRDGVAKIVEAMRTRPEGFIFANLVDFDALYGHRNDITGYAAALEEFDAALPEILAGVTNDDLLILCADHGNDPTTPGTDHSREYCPILAYARHLPAERNIGTRRTLADIGAVVASNFGVRPPAGTAFM